MASISQDQPKFRPSTPKASMYVSQHNLQPRARARPLQPLMRFSRLVWKKLCWFKARKPNEPESPVDAVHSPATLDRIPSATLLDSANSHPVTPDTPSPWLRSNKWVLTALKQVLPALSAISRTAFLPGLDVAFDSLLTVIIKVETTSENLEGFGDLVDRLKTLKSTLSRFDGTGKASTDLGHLLDPLRREIESLRSDIDRAGSRGGLGRFLNSTNDASSLASHNVRLDRIISQLTLDVTTSTSHGVDQVLQGVTRVENVLSSRGESATMGMTQVFRGAKINTVGSGNSTGGHVGSGNVGVHLQDYEQAEITSSGTVGSGNTATRNGSVPLQHPQNLVQLTFIRPAKPLK